MELKVEDERRLKLVSDCYQAQLLFEAWEGTWLHTYRASCQAGCHCGMRGDGIELTTALKWSKISIRNPVGAVST
jgi:hypothetical protein